MTIPVLKIKVLPKSTLKGKMDVRFPANVVGENFITVERANGTYTFGVDYTVLTPGSISDPTTAYIAIEDQTSGIYRTVTLASLLTSGLDADLQAIAALTGTGILARTAANTWSVRTITAGASIGVTNGDGVSGNPTIAVTDPELVAIAGLTSAADQLPYFTGSGTASLATFTAFARTLVDDVTQGAMQITLGLVPGTNVQAFDADLAALAANAGTGLWVVTGAGTGSVRTITAPAAGITISNGGGVAGNPTLALANDLAALEGLSGTGIARRTGTDAWSVGTAVANSELATMGAYTFKGNNTGSSATPSDVDIAALTTKASPASTDLVMISDQAASGAWKKVSVSSLASAGSVASIAGNTGAFTLSGGITNAANNIIIDGIFGYRNRIINPTGQIVQTAFAATADASYTGFDQWYVLTQSNPVTPSQNVLPETGTPYMMRVTQSNASAQRFGLATPLETDNARELRGGQLTLSARVQMSASTTLRYAVVEWSGTPDSITRDVVNDWTSATFTTGNFFISTTTAISAQGSIALTANTLTSITPLTFTAGSTHQNLIVFFWTDSTQAQNVTLDIGKVQLERGASATGFAIRPIALEQVLCERFLRVIGNGIATNQHINIGMAFSSTIFRTVFKWFEPMRIAPTGSVSAASDFQVDDTSVTPAGASASFTTSIDQVTFQVNTAGSLTTARAGFLQAVNTSARIFLKAQL